MKDQIKKLANNFKLDYYDSWFSSIWISVRHHILLEYIGGCPDQAYNKYGKTLNKRMKNIDKFFNSKDFNECLKRYGGQVSSKNGLKKELELISKIKNLVLKRELIKINKEIKRAMNKAEQIAILTIPKNNKEKEWLMKYCLRHEWIHILLDKNKIKFQDKNKKLWPYDEGINEYMGAFLDNKLRDLERLRDKEKYSMERKNWIYAIKFRELLKNAKTPKERKKIINKFLKDL